MVYHRLCTHPSRYLNDQPAITRVNRQLRAEALPVYYSRPVTLCLGLRPFWSWAESIERLVDAFSVKAGLPGSSTLRHITGLQLNLESLDVFGMHIAIDMMSDPQEMMQRFPYNDIHERVVVGSPGMDWTDATAVRAACHEAATRLENISIKTRATIEAINSEAREIDEFAGRYELTSNMAHQRAALDAMCAYASACPHLTRGVCIVDMSDWFYL